MTRGWVNDDRMFICWGWTIPIRLYSSYDAAYEDSRQQSSLGFGTESPLPKINASYPNTHTHSVLSPSMSYIILEQGSTGASVVMKRVPAVLLKASLWRCGPFLCRAEWLPPPGTSGWNLVQVSIGPGSSVATSLIQLKEFHQPWIPVHLSLPLSVFLLPTSISLLPHPSANLRLSNAKSKTFVLPCLFWSLRSLV